MEELEGYNKQLEEFETFGDVSEVSRYLKKAQTLNTRLEAAQEKVLLVLIYRVHHILCRVLLYVLPSMWLT